MTTISMLVDVLMIQEVSFVARTEKPSLDTKLKRALTEKRTEDFVAWEDEKEKGEMNEKYKKETNR